MDRFKKSCGIFLACLTCVTPFVAQQAQADQNYTLSPEKSARLKAGSIGIKLIRDGDGNLEMVIMDANGNQEDLTFGNFLSYSVDAILRESINNCSLARTEPIYIGYEWKDKVLYSSIYQSNGNKSVFTFSNFLNALSKTITNCRRWDNSMIQPPNTATILFEKVNDAFQTMIIGVDGKKQMLNLGNLLSVSSVAFPDCAPGVEKERIIQIAIDSSKKEKLKIYQVDAYGKKEDLTFDNLATAAAETLETCAKDKSKPFAKPLPNALTIKFKESESGDIQTYIMTQQGDEVEMTLGTLLTSAAQMVPFYEGNTDKIVISYTQNPDGTATGKITDLNGKMMDLTLENLVLAAALFYPY